MKRIWYAKCPYCDADLDILWDRETPLGTITEDDVRGWCDCPTTMAEAQKIITEEKNDLG